MDRRLKERLVGAAILVFFAVLFIPEMLSGPVPPRPSPGRAVVSSDAPGAGASLRTYTVDLEHPASGAVLAPQAAPATKVETPAAAVPAAPDASPQPERTAAAEKHPVAEGPAVVRQAPRAGPAPANTFAPIDARGGWSLQLGSFANRANAEKLVQSLHSKGIRVYISSSGSRHRVRAGPFPDRASAERAAGKLRAQGHATSLIPP